MDDIKTVDVFVIGGGINGTGIARDAAGRGLSVALCEKGDLAQGTSSRSGKLVHGGLRYLEYYEFRLVREALQEREILLGLAPHIIWPMRFVLPHSPQDRPAWLIRLGLFLYDHLGGRKRLPGTRVLKLRDCPEGEPLGEGFSKGFEYSDCWVDDARLVVLNAMDASISGAEVHTRCEFQSATRVNNHWLISICNNGAAPRQYRARALVNATGPWVNNVLDKVSGASTDRNVRLVKGSHIVVKKFWSGDHAYLLQNADGRVVFVNPYEKYFALIGTTDVPQRGNPESVEIEQAEVDYLLDTVNRYFNGGLGVQDVVYSYAGVRPLYDDASENPSAVTRDYILDIDQTDCQAPLLSVFGGKITTFRKLAEQALDQLKPYLGDMEGAWTSGSPLPGGDITDANLNAFIDDMQAVYPWLGLATIDHLARTYGTLMTDVIGDARHADALGEKFSATFYQREAEYLIDREWAMTAEDILYRRTKHGLHMNEAERGRFQAWDASRNKTPVNV